LKTKQSVGPSLPGSLEAELNRDGTLAVLWDPLNNADSSGHVYDVATGKELGRAAGSKSGLLSTAVGDVKFSGNSRQVFTRSQDGIRLWDIDAQKVVRSPRILGKIQYAAFNADRSIVLILLQRSALVWRVSDTSGGNFPEKDFTSPILSAALSSDGRLAAIVSGNKAYLWNIASGALTSLDNSDKADTVGFTADQQQVVLVGDSKVRLWNAKTGRPGPFWKSGDTVLDFQSGGQVFVEESDEDILLRDIGTFQPVARVLTRGQLDNWKLSQDGHTLATATGGRTQAEVWDMTPGPAPMPPSQEEKSSATEVPALTAAQIDGMVAGWQNKPGSRFTSGVVSRDGSKVLLMKDAVFGIDEPPEVRDAKTGALIMPILLGGAAGTQAGAKFAGALSDDGRLAAVSASTGNAQVFDLTTRQQVGQPWTQMTGIQALRFTPDASHLIMANSDLTARLFYVPLGSIVGDPVIHAGPVTQISLSADGSMALTTSSSNTVAWDVFLGSGSSGSGSSKDGDALADLAEAAGGMRLAPGGSAPEMIPLAQRLSLIQNLSPQLSVLDPRVAAAISRFQAALQKR
jgi:WD40 repeat protein